MKPQERLAYIVTAIALSAITGMYWWAAEPPSWGIFAFMAVGALVCFGIILARKRAGHYDKSSTR